MIPIDFFACTAEQILASTFDQACDRFACIGFVFPDARAIASLMLALTGRQGAIATALPGAAPICRLSVELTAALKMRSCDELMDAAVLWSTLPPWDELEPNAMDLAGFLLSLQALAGASAGTEHAVFLWLDPRDWECIGSIGAGA